MFSLLRFGVKAGLVSSAVYVTIDYGVWNDSEATNKLYKTISSEISKQTSPYLDKVTVNLPEIPRTGSYISTAQSTWNMRVISTFKFLAASPTCAAGYAQKGYEYLKSQISIALEEGGKATAS